MTTVHDLNFSGGLDRDGDTGDLVRVAAAAEWLGPVLAHEAQVTAMPVLRERVSKRPLSSGEKWFRSGTNTSTVLVSQARFTTSVSQLYRSRSAWAIWLRMSLTIFIHFVRSPING